MGQPLLREQYSVRGSGHRHRVGETASPGNQVGPDAAGARQISMVANPDLWRRATLTCGKDCMGIGKKALAAKNERHVRERLGAAERDVLRQRISTAVRDRELADADAWKEKVNGRKAARQRP